MSLQPDLLRLAKLRQSIATGEALAVRQRALLSLPEFAAHCGVTHTTMQRWERGERVPRGEGALRYADLLTLLDGLDRSVPNTRAVPA